jgi:hypothetical protein
VIAVGGVVAFQYVISPYLAYAGDQPQDLPGASMVLNISSTSRATASPPSAMVFNPISDEDAPVPPMPRSWSITQRST